MQFPYRKLFDRDPTTGKLDLVQRPLPDWVRGRHRPLGRELLCRRV